MKIKVNKCPYSEGIENGLAYYGDLYRFDSRSETLYLLIDVGDNTQGAVRLVGTSSLFGSGEIIPAKQIPDILYPVKKIVVD